MKNSTVAPVFHYYADNAHWQTNYSDGSGYSATLTTARTALRLFTGGKALEHHMSLIQLQCSGLKYGAPSGTWGWPWLDMEMTVIDPSTMKVLGQSPGSDGNLWVAEPDNAGVALNLTAPGEHYGAWATATKYTPTITASTNGTAIDLSTNTPEFCVGQQVTFTLNNLPTGSISNMAGQWNLPGKFVNEILTPDPLESEASSTYDIDNALLQNTNQTSCWFYDEPGGKVVVGMNLLMNNGQDVSIATDGSISIYKPSVTNFSSSGPQINFNTNSSPEVLDANFNCSAVVYCSSNFSGTATYTQLINRAETNDYSIYGWTHEYSGGFLLDGDSPYGGDTPVTLPSTAHVNHGDDPSISDGFPTGSFLNYIYCKDSFKLYLQFTPSGSDSIPITLGRIDWGWEACEQETNGVWTLTVNNPSGATPDWSDDSFPTWEYIRPK